MPGKSGSSGMTIVCCRATTVPHNDRMPITAQVGAERRARGELGVTGITVAPPARPDQPGASATGRSTRSPRTVDAVDAGSNEFPDDG